MPLEPAGSAAIHTEGLGKVYGSIRALGDLSMTVPRGEVFGFLGPNGAGKTTAVKILLGLTGPTSGSGWVLGKPAGDVEARRRIGYLPELFRYQSWMTAYEVLQLHCDLAGLAGSTAAGSIERSLVTVGLAERAHDRVSTFSKGMQQRLGLGVALVGDPELVFLDEPTSALDPVGRKEVRDVIRGLRERGATVFLNSHLLSEVEMICDRVAIIRRGKLLAVGAMGELLGGSSVRVQVSELPESALGELAGFGRPVLTGSDLEVLDIEPDGVPDLVAHLVHLGARVHAVEHAHRTLEERFIELLGTVE